MKKTIFALSLAGAAFVFITACKHDQPGPSASDYFQTPFQNESQFIVQTIATDVAEQLYYAKFHKVPEVHISVVEAASTNVDAPVYDVRIDLDSRYKKLKSRITVNGAIWSPEVYDDLASKLGQKIGLATGSNEESKDTALAGKLTDGLAATIEDENEDVSANLSTDFSNPTLHEQAALVLGAFTLREHSGHFFEIRSPLCRITSHLVLARYLGGKDSTGINGSLARIILLTLMHDEAEAVTELNGLSTNNPALLAWSRAMRARNTADYRPLDKVDGLSPVESTEWFQALEITGNGDLAWNRLSDAQKTNVDFVRIANAENPSVSVGHALLDVAMSLEFAEQQTVSRAVRGKELDETNAIEALNALPDRAFSKGADGQTGVHVIGWGLWAGFLQRQLCHAVEQDFEMLQRKWGVPEDAKKFADETDPRLGGLRLYPLVLRMDAVTSEQYHKAEDEGFKVTVATPQLVPAECWNYLCYTHDNESYVPVPNPHVNEWFNHNPPPGTAYDVQPRLRHPSLTNRGNDAMTRLHELAPYNWFIANYIYEHQYNKQPTYPQAEALFSEVLPYSWRAMTAVAGAERDQPDKYEYLMNRAAEVNPYQYYPLADYFIDLKQDDKGSAYIEKADSLDPSGMNTAYYADWQIRHFLDKGRTEDARKLADFAGEVYSYYGLMAKADFLERTGDYAGAYQWYANIMDRYNDANPLVSYYIRYKAKTGDTRFDAPMQELSARVFPKGMQKVALADFKAAPADGVLIEGDNDTTHGAGIKQGDVIVAISGIQVHNFFQYQYERSLDPVPELDLIVWQGNGYQEIKASPPKHLFGVNFGDYPQHN